MTCLRSANTQVSTQSLRRLCTVTSGARTHLDPVNILMKSISLVERANKSLDDLLESQETVKEYRGYDHQTC